MKSNVLLIIIFTLILSFVGCEDFLEREPKDFLSEENYFEKPSDLELFVNKFYNSFTTNTDRGATALYAIDRNSDDIIGPSEEENFLKGYKLVPSSAGGGLRDWNFSNIRETNYFIKVVQERIKEERLDSENVEVKQYIGENYFFRAWFYFNKLTAFGDFPIITEVLPDDDELLIQASKREPRNEVARFILEDLDKAIELLQDGGSKNRISKSVAQLLASRVALFEGTWLKYHKGTSRVPGGSDWPGSGEYSDYTFPTASIEAESDYFLDKAMIYADIVASKHGLYHDYRHLFVAHDLESIDEVLLLNDYGIGTVQGHAATHYLQRTGAGVGFTRSIVETFLMENGLPIYAVNSEYEGDSSLKEAMQKRDLRLQVSVLSEGDIRKENEDGSKEFFDYPNLFSGSGWQAVTSGYQMQKWMSRDPNQAKSTTSGTTQTPIFRVAEAYLNYIEASYERTGSLNSMATDYWKRLRERAGVDADLQKTISNTDLNQEIDLAIYSAGAPVDATLFNIRRERRSEFIAEGMRLMDLYRWSALDTMKDYIVEGFNLWDNYYKNFENELNEGENISYSPKNGGSKYLQPFRISSSNRAYNGYNFPLAHYLNPIPLDQFVLTGSAQDGGILYQNPGWSKTSAAPAQ